MVKKLFPFLTLLVLLFAIPVAGRAQSVSSAAPRTVTLDQAVAIALENSPRLKSASAAIERSRAARGESWELAPTTVDYSWGQLNGTNRNDHEIAVTQSVGSLLTPFYKNALVKRQVATGNYYREMVVKEITAEVKRAWSYYLYAMRLRELYGEQNALAEKLLRIGELRYEQGDITLLERNMTATLAADMKNKSFQAVQEFALAAERLRWVCYADAPLMPSDTLPLTFRTDFEGVQTPSQSHVGYFNSLVDEQTARARVEKSRFFPEISLGYTRQQILPEKGLNAWVVGASFPIFFNAQRSRIRQAKYDAYIARNDADANIRAIDNRLRELQAELRRYAQSIEYYTSSALPEAEALVRAADAELRGDETDVSQYIQSLNAALEIKSGYADAIYRYNVAALEYELYR